MRFAIFKASFPGETGPFNITFTALMNPAEPSEPMTIEAADVDTAVVEATGLLRLLRVSTHTILGDPSLVMSDFPNYYVGELNDQVADMYDTPSIAFRISTFRAVNKK